MHCDRLAEAHHKSPGLRENFASLSVTACWFTHHSTVSGWNDTTVERDEAAAYEGLEKADITAYKSQKHKHLVQTNRKRKRKKKTFL